jgi:type IV secretion system protein VirD4
LKNNFQKVQKEQKNIYKGANIINLQLIILWLSFWVAVCAFVIYLFRRWRNRHANPARAGNNVPFFMLSPFRKKIGFFFGVKIKAKGFFSFLRYYVGKPMNEDGHILVVGGAGSHKSSALAIPSLETWDGLIVAVDIKGELLTEWQRLNGNSDKKLKVFAPTKADTCAYDPYTLLRLGGKENLVHNARELALSMIPLPPNIQDPFWIEASQDLLEGAILHCFSMGASFNDTMYKISITPVKMLIDEIANSDVLEAKICVNTLVGYDEKSKTLAGIATQISNRIKVFASDPLIKNAFDTIGKENIIDWADLNDPEKACDIILHLPEDKLEQWENPVKLLVNQLIRTLERRPNKNTDEGKKQLPLLVLLDEVARFGKLTTIKSGLATLRDRAVTFALFIQSMAQIEEIYGEKAAQIIVDNCTYRAILRATDTNSQKYFSGMVGTCEVEKVSLGSSYDGDSIILPRSKSVNKSTQREPIIFPHEFACLKDVVLMTPDGFCRVDKAPYYLEPAYRGEEIIDELMGHKITPAMLLRAKMKRVKANVKANRSILNAIGNVAFVLFILACIMGIGALLMWFFMSG